MKLIKNKRAQRSVVSVFFWILVIMLIVGIGFYTSNLAKITGFAVKQATESPTVLTGEAVVSKNTQNKNNDKSKLQLLLDNKYVAQQKLESSKKELTNIISNFGQYGPITDAKRTAALQTFRDNLANLKIASDAYSKEKAAYIKKYPTSPPPPEQPPSSTPRTTTPSLKLITTTLQKPNAKIIPPANVVSTETGVDRTTTKTEINTKNQQITTETTKKTGEKTIEITYYKDLKKKVEEVSADGNIQKTESYDIRGNAPRVINAADFESQKEIDGIDNGDGTKKITIGDGRTFIVPYDTKIIMSASLKIPGDFPYAYTIGDTKNYVKNIGENGNYLEIANEKGETIQKINFGEATKSFTYKDANDKIQQQIYLLKPSVEGDSTTVTYATITYGADGKPVGSVQIGGETLTADAFRKLVPENTGAGFSKANLDSLLQKLPGLQDAVLTNNVLISKDGAQTYAVDGNAITFTESKPNVKIDGKIADFTSATSANYEITDTQNNKKLTLDDGQYQSLQQQINNGHFSDNYKVSDDSKTLVDGSKIYYKIKNDIPNEVTIANSLKTDGTIIEQKKDKIVTYYPTGEFAESKSATSYVKYSQDYYPNEVNGIKIDYGSCGTAGTPPLPIPCTTSAVFTLKDSTDKPIDCDNQANTENCKAAKSAVFQSRVGIALTAAYQAALGASALGNFLFGTQAFEGWKKSIDELFTRSILGIVAAPEDFLCRSYIDKPGEGYALAPSPSGFAQAVAHVEADRSTAIIYPNATNPLQNITEYLYKITFAVTAPNDQDVDFNVYLYPGERPLFVNSKRLGKGSTHREAGSSARVKYSAAVYGRVCIKFTSKVNFPDTVCNRINVYSEPTVLYGTALTPEQVAAGASAQPTAQPATASGSPSNDW